MDEINASPKNFWCDIETVDDKAKKEVEDIRDGEEEEKDERCTDTEEMFE
jgi:hypothetical protein